ncbi:MAG TPA: hypothetical protein VJ784_20345 [Pyrinomonadaceae bacterium]|nr:hypothetical protein [Pyrinomonadaceae bacterium]
MEELFKTYASHVALLLEAIAAIVITVGAVGAVIKLINPAGGDPAKPFRRSWDLNLNSLQSFALPQLLSRT